MNRDQLELRSVSTLRGLASKVCKAAGMPSFDFGRDDRTNSKDKLIGYLFLLSLNNNIDLDALMAELDGKPATHTVAMPDATTQTRTPDGAVVDAPSDAELAAVLRRVMGMPSIDLSQVRKIAAEVAAETVRAAVMPIIVHVQHTSGETVEIKGAHKQFPDLLQICQSRNHSGQRLNVWLSGPAGSGKTTAAHQVALALKVPFYFCGAIDTEYKLIGYTDANGRTVRRPFREAFSQPSVFLFDEVDSSGASAVLALNAALANGSCDFPDAIEQRHTDCCIIAAANTFGTGGTHDYCGRVKQDAAFLDRFVMLDWELDETIESTMTDNSNWVRIVQRVRRNCAKHGVKHIVSPRATDFGAALLKSGMSEDKVIALTLRKGLDKATWDKVAP